MKIRFIALERVRLTLVSMIIKYIKLENVEVLIRKVTMRDI